MYIYMYMYMYMYGAAPKRPPDLIDQSIRRVGHAQSVGICLDESICMSPAESVFRLRRGTVGQNWAMHRQLTRHAAAVSTAH